MIITSPVTTWEIFYSRQKQFDLAISNYQAALAAQPAYADAHNNLAGLFLDQKRYDEAIPHYREALRLKPQFVSYFNLANALADTASARHDTNLFARPSAPISRPCSSSPIQRGPDNFGLTWQAQNQDSEAIAEFQAAVRINPKFELAHFNLANALSRVGRLDEAIAHYETAARLNPPAPNPSTERASATPCGARWRPPPASSNGSSS